MKKRKDVFLVQLFQYSNSRFCNNATRAKNTTYPSFKKKVMIFFWNNRNARRKQSGTMVWWFKDFLDIVGHLENHFD